MKTYKVTDLLETAYLYDTTVKDLINLITKCTEAKNGIMPKNMPNDLQMKVVEEVATTKELPIFDIAGIHVTDNAATTISMYQVSYNIHFTDSENAGRDAVLKYNMEEARKGEPTIVDIPIWNDDENIEEYYRKFDNSVVYRFQRGDNMELYFALACFYLLSGKKQNFLISDGVGKEFLKYVHRGVQPANFKDEDEFFAIDIRAKFDTAVVDIVRFDHSTDKIVTREQLTMDFDKAWGAMYLVPRSIEDITKYGGDTKRYNTLLDMAYTDIANYQSSKPRDLYTILVEANDHKE